MSLTLGPDHIKQMLNRYAKTQSLAKRGAFDVALEEEKLVVEWTQDQRVERFLVKPPTTTQEAQGAVTDIFYRLKQRLTSPTVASVTSTVSKPVKK